MAIKSFRSIKPDGEKIRRFIIQFLKLIHQINQAKLENEIKQINKFSFKK